MDTKFYATEHGDAALTISIVGHHDIFRLAVNMLDDQVEFSEAGNRILAKLRDHVGHERFDAWASNMLGSDRYAYLAGHRCFQHRGEDL